MVYFSVKFEILNVHGLSFMLMNSNIDLLKKIVSEDLFHF